MPSRFLVALTVAGAVAAGISCSWSSGKAREDVHDQAFGDNHPWNAHEAFMFRRHWADEHGGAYRPYQKLARQDQDDYWSWRHTHPD